MIQGPEEPWYEVGDEVTFNSNEVEVAGIGTVMGVIRLTNDLLRELPDGWYYEIDTIAEKIPGRKGWLTQDQMKAVRSMACLIVAKEAEQHAAWHLCGDGHLLCNERLYGRERLSLHRLFSRSKGIC